MKNIALSIVLLFVFYFCKDELDPRLSNFSNVIISNPEKLRNLKDNFPDLIDNEYLIDELRDTTYINKLIFYINDEYRKNSGSRKLRFSQITEEYIKTYFKIPQKYINTEHFFEFSIWKGNKAISFMFITENGRFFLCDIYKSLNPYYED